MELTIKKQPINEAEKIRIGYVNWGYEIEFEGEEAATVLALHKAILENKESDADRKTGKNVEPTVLERLAVHSG